ncbi:uncharacterized protein TNCV_1497671 [Trichonephila clavipes]|nr:uncharacterized protein TNCV_1497671 [Trichonephila clavipes]
MIWLPDIAVGLHQHMLLNKTKLKLDDRGRLFPEGWEKKINYDVKVEQIKKTSTKNGEGGPGTLREDCGIIRKQASTDGGVLWKVVCVNVVQVRRKDRTLRDPREARSRVRFGLAIHQNDHQARRRFVEWAQNEIAVVPDFHKRILFSDEAHFWLNGYVNKQNCRIWSEANPQVYVETPLHPEKLTVWCALWAGGIIGPYFKNDEGHNFTVNGDRYRAMITNFFIFELYNHDVQELWF